MITISQRLVFSIKILQIEYKGINGGGGGGRGREEKKGGGGGGSG